MNIAELKEQDPMFFDHLSEEIKDTFDGDLNITLRELAEQFDLPVSVVKSILMDD